MIPKKDRENVDLDAVIDKDLAKAQEKQKEKISKSKPRLAKAVSSRYIKYIIVFGTVIVIGYKMFFAPVPEESKRRVKKISKSSNKDAEKQQRLADKAAPKTKDTISQEKPDEKKIVSFDSQTISNSESLSSVSVPKLSIPSVPTLPMIDKITLKEDRTGNNQDGNDGAKKDAIKADRDRKTSINQIDSQRNENEKGAARKRIKKKIKDANGKNKIVEVEVEVDDAGNIIKEYMVSDENALLKTSLSERLTNDVKNKIASNKKQNLSIDSGLGMRSLEEMFVLSGPGMTNQSKASKSSAVGKKDFILFDGSSIYENEVLTDQSNTNVSKISNLENTIIAGKVMEGVLETAINSESAGIIRAVVSKDVLGERGNKILIPRGSRLYGSYTTTSTATQTRLLLTWTKVVRPDGVVISMNADTYDQSGRKGIEGDIDTRYGELLKNSLLYSFVTLATAVAVEKIAKIKGQTSIVAGNGTSVTNTSPANAAATSVIETAQDIAEKMTDGLTDDLNPVISIPQGLLLKIMSSTDIVINSAYKRRTQAIKFD